MKKRNTLEKLQTLGKIGGILSRIAFTFSVIGFCGCVAGLLSATLGNGTILRWGGVTLHGILSGGAADNLESTCAALSGLLIVCAGEAVLAGFAAAYFRNGQRDGTPFTLRGAKELLRLGILACVLPVASATAASIAEGIVAGHLSAAGDGFSDRFFQNDVSFALGVMFLVMSLLCRYGAEQSAHSGS